MSRVVLAGVLLAALVLSGCATLTNLVALGNDIGDAGYRYVSCHANTLNGHTVLDVSASTFDEATATDDDANRIAEVVWKKYDGSFDELRITLNGSPALVATPDDLTDRFGDRPFGVVTGTKEGSDFTTVIVVTIVAALLVTGLAVLVWWRGRRPPRPVAPPPTYPYPPTG